MSERGTGRIGPKRVLIIAGEASGDLHGADLVRAIRGLAPEVRFYGIGGENLKKAEAELLFHNSRLAVVGIVEVLTKLRSIVKALGRVKRSLSKNRFDLAILIDFPDFNLHVANYLKRRGVPILYYISPQIWAWRESRLRKIKRLVDRMVVILPFEAAFYQRRGVDAVFVGHPLLDIVKPRQNPPGFLRPLGMEKDRRIVGLFPGSRDQEVQRLLPTMLEAARLMVRRLPALHFLVCLAPDIDGEAVGRSVRAFELPADVVQDSPYDTMAASDLLLVASGTVTIEAAILTTPMVILYKVSPLTYWIGRIMAKVKHIGLVNLVAGKTVAPELIQESASPERLSHEALSLLLDENRLTAMKSELASVREKLGTPGASSRAAYVALGMLTRAA